MRDSPQRLLVREVSDLHYGESPLSDCRTERRQPMCPSQLSSVCSVCDLMMVELTKYQGCKCLKSKCKLGFWTGGNQWNRLSNL